ncbi:MAG: DUF881 domain-containing protein [Thermacetogeniaceae bacterium]|nr:DUF881 domain-containing protein [Syntrophomonadaceae bacterium]
MRFFKNWQLPLAFVLFFTGIMLMLALHAVHGEADSPTQQKNKKLITMVQQQEEELEQLKKSLHDKRESLNKYQKSLSEGKLETEKLQYELDKLLILSGLYPVQGEGISVHLDDNTKGKELAIQKNPDTRIEDFLIHDKHLLYIVYELRAAGAEAISINNQRVIGPTDIRCVGTTIQVNAERLGPPFIIKAIGDPDNLTRALETERSQYNILKMSGFPVKIEKHNNLVIDSYKGSYQFTHAQPKEEE